MVDVVKCLGCRKGIDTWQENDGELHHFDFFATKEAGAIYKCNNSEELKKIGLDKIERNGLLTPKKDSDLDIFFKEQEFWWEDYVELLWEIFKTQEEVNKYFNEDTFDNGTILGKLSNEELEELILKEAFAHDVEVTEDNYPDLYVWKTKQ